MILEVGKPYAPLTGRGEGVLFDIDDGGAKLLICFCRPTAQEIAATQAGQPFQIRFLEMDGIIWILAKCGSLAWMDAPYNPRTSLYTRLPNPDKGTGLALTLVMADARTTEIKSLRMIGLGEGFSAALVDTAERLRHTHADLREVNQNIRETMGKYSTDELVKMAQHSFSLILE